MSSQASQMDYLKQNKKKIGTMCQHCNKIYSSEGHLNRHLKSKHLEPIPNYKESKRVDFNNTIINISNPYQCAMDLGVNVCNTKAMEIVFSKFNTKLDGVIVNGESYDIDISYSFEHKDYKIGPCSQYEYIEQFTKILRDNRNKITDDEIKNIIEYCQNSSGFSYTINGDTNGRMICDSINHKGWIHSCYNAFTVFDFNRYKLSKLNVQETKTLQETQ